MAVGPTQNDIQIFKYIIIYIYIRRPLSPQRGRRTGRVVTAQVQGWLVNEHSRRVNIISVIVASFAPQRRVFFVIMMSVVVIRVFFVCVSSVALEPDILPARRDLHSQ